MNWLHLFVPRKQVDRSQQPDFGRRHIKSVDELRVGRRYLRISGTSRYYVQLTKLPHDVQGMPSPRIEYRHIDIDFTETSSLADSGLVPYNHEGDLHWNLTNHMRSESLFPIIDYLFLNRGARRRALVGGILWLAVSVFFCTVAAMSGFGLLFVLAGLALVISASALTAVYLSS